MKTVFSRFVFSILIGLLFCGGEALAAPKTAPSITTQPANLTVTVGQAASFTVVASGTATLTYQWQKGGVPIVGATAATYKIASTVSTDAALYTVVVSNSLGSVTSNVATLTVNAAATKPVIVTSPVSQSVALGQSVSFTVVATSTGPMSYTWKKNGTAITNTNSATYTIAAVTVADAGSYVAVVSSTGGVSGSSTATLTVIEPPAITTQPAGLVVSAGQTATFSVVSAGTAPFTYQWLKNGAAISGATGSSFSIAAPVAADIGSYSVTISNSAGSVTSALADLGVITPPSIATAPANLTVNAGQAASFGVSVSGTAPFSYQWKKDGVAISGANAATYSIAATSATDVAAYSVTVINSAGSVTSTAATLAVVIPPSLTTQPVALTANSGKSASFSVVAAGTAPFTYQWLKNGVPIAGATAATYSINTVTSLDAASYAVVVANPAGTVTSSAAALTVVLPPVITTQPISLTIITGKSASFSVGATSTVALTYQWNKNGVAIAGATGATYSLAATAATDAGAYSVTVTNSAGSVVSSAATLTVAETPTYNRMCTTSVRSVITATKPSALIGFTTEGASTRRLLVRGVGPALAQYGVTNVLAQPKIEVHTKVNGVDTVLASNTQWSDEPKAAEAFIEAGAFAFDAGSKDVAIVIELSAGAYTVVLSGVNGSTGTALVEIYELP